MSKDLETSRELSPSDGGPRASGEATFWTPSDLIAPPTDGPFWAWLHQTGIRKMRWDPDFYDDDGAYVLAEDALDDFDPEFWAPFASIADPAVEWADARAGADQ